MKFIYSFVVDIGLIIKNDFFLMVFREKVEKLYIIFLVIFEI